MGTRMLFDGISLKVRNYKCIGDDPQGFDGIKPINVVIGRNNSGKSTLLDILELICQENEFDFKGRGHQRHQSPSIIFGKTVEHDTFEKMRNSRIVVSTPEGRRFDVADPSHWACVNMCGSQISISITKDKREGEFFAVRNVTVAKNHDLIANEIARRLVPDIRSLLPKFDLRRLQAERNIRPEGLDIAFADIASDGTGLTRVFERILNDSQLNSALIEHVLLNALNEILEPDIKFTRIRVQQHNQNQWELFFDEDKKGAISLSDTGSGVKTILAVLANLLIVPKMKGKRRELDGYVFAFEELENHMHPAVQRRLFHFLRRFAVDNKCHFFITTHSNVVIDLFSRDELAQIIHVTHNGSESRAQAVTQNQELSAILDDLDVRASDLLQTNVVVWVEGPSDRIYFCKWIEIWTDGELAEGIHFQCLPFGGSCNAHLSFEEAASEASESLIAALKINRRAILLADSDRWKDGDQLKEHTGRLNDEVGKAGGLAWITAGREVENYIPQQALKDLYGLGEALGVYEEVIARIRETDGHKSIRKTEIANDVCKLLTKDMLRATYDMATKLDEVCDLIRQWNRKETQAS